jgi:hypothetical protein
MTQNFGGHSQLDFGGTARCKVFLECKINRICQLVTSMAGVYQTEFQFAADRVQKFLDALGTAGINFDAPFDLVDDGCAGRITAPEMRGGSFIVDFWPIVSGNATRRVDLHWHHSNRGTDEENAGFSVATLFEKIAVQHGAVILWGAISQNPNA